MPPTLCSRCRHANPPEAVFCHFDGTELRAGGSARAGLPQEFVFASGRRCRTFDELVQGCQYEWEEARDLLFRGAFTGYLTKIGRQDLVRAAKEARANPDPDIALHSFVNALPVNQAQGPRLELEPRRLVLGTFRSGETRDVRLVVSNSGKGILQGKLTLSDGGKWVRLVDGDAGGGLALKAPREQVVALRVDARGLPGPKAYLARVTVVTNGGVAEVPIRLDIVGVPFPRPPFQGVGSQRELAERMKAQPKPAVPLLAHGDVARWFAANGWTYPVQGPTARGVAAVQQFFEGMGLSKPPTVTLDEDEFRYVCQPPEVAPGQIVLRAAAKKWVYAHADTDMPWLRVLEPSVSGPQQAVLPFEVDSSLMDEGRVHEGHILIVANAGQRLSARVIVDIRRSQEPFTRRLLRPFLSGLL